MMMYLRGRLVALPVIFTVIENVYEREERSGK
jgi:hypothetical protein